MLNDYRNGQTSVVFRAKLRDSSVTTGAGKTGLVHNTSGLVISTIADNEATATAYTVAASNVETVATLGTYAAPTSGKCRFREVDATNHPGVYEFQFADARFAVSGAKSLLVSVSGASNLAQCDILIPLRAVDPYDSAAGGMTRLDAAVSSRLAPTTAGRTLDVSAGGEAGIDWSNVGAPTTTLNLSGTTIGVAADVTTKTGYSLASGGLDAVVVETGVNARQALSGVLAACAGVVSGAGTGTITIKGGGVATTRVVATTDASGNRSAVTLTLPS